MATWPPPGWQQVHDKISEWSAWLAGDRAQLEAQAQQQHTASPGSGIVGTLTRWFRTFWGAPPQSGGPSIKVHVPLAADIAAASSDLLFGEPPAIKARQSDSSLEALLDDQAEDRLDVGVRDTQARLQRYIDDGLLSTLAGAAEVAAGLGGVFLRVTWTMHNRRAFLSRVDVDAAYPEFEFDQLRRVVFCRVLPNPRPERSTSRVYRHLETHEVDDNGIGVIRHQLYDGTSSDLGMIAALTEHPALEGIAALLEETEGDTISTGTPGLAVVYIPNRTPNNLWRTNPVGACLGAADIAQSEDLLDRLDHAFSALFRELDLARARITIPEAWLDNMGPGQGQRFQADREVFTALALPGTSDVKPELFQPAIRVDEHLKVMQETVEVILRRAGYSAATFGEDEDGNAATATEINARTGRSRTTRSRKLRHWQPAVEQIIRKLLAVDVELGRVHGAGIVGDPDAGFARRTVDPKLLSVEFPAPAMSPTELAGMVQAWNIAQAVSTEVKVRTLHPEWDDDQVVTEVRRVKAEQGIGGTVADPTTARPPGALMPGQPAEADDVVDAELVEQA